MKSKTPVYVIQGIGIIPARKEGAVAVIRLVTGTAGKPIRSVAHAVVTDHDQGIGHVLIGGVDGAVDVVHQVLDLLEVPVVVFRQRDRASLRAIDPFQAAPAINQVLIKSSIMKFLRPLSSITQVKHSFLKASPNLPKQTPQPAKFFL